MHGSLLIVFLGTGGSWPSRERNVSALALQYGPQVLLFDCGEGTQRQLMRSSVSFMKIRQIFISHFHGDHFLGLPGLLQSMYLNNRTEPLEVIGPKGTIAIVSTFMQLGYFNPTFELRLRELAHDETYEGDDFQIRAARVDHSVPALAYAFEEASRPGKFNKPRALELGIAPGPLYAKLQRGETITVGRQTITPDMVLGPPRPGRKIVYSGDTRPCENLVELATDADVLIHDSTALSMLEEKINDYGHSTAAQAATIARRAGARSLFLTHISPRYRDAGPLENEAAAIFENSIVAEDYLEHDVSYRN